MSFISVAVAVPVHGTFIYGVPDGFDVRPGMRVVVPFGKRKLIGICIESHKVLPDGINPKAVKSVESVPDEYCVFDGGLIRLVKWISSYYLAPIGEVCKAALPSRVMRVDAPITTRPEKPHEITSSTLGRPLHKLTLDQQNALDIICKTLDLQNQSSSSPTNSATIQKGRHSCESRNPDQFGEKLDPRFRGDDKQRHQAFLLQGITGSGKTQVYLECLERVVKNGKQGLLLVPEIGLTPQLTARVVEWFGERVAVYHSALTEAQRHKQWLQVKEAKVDVVVGTRSAMFAPFINLGLVVVDEEHDSSFKQDDGVTYNARDAAIMRAHLENVPVVLGSATPSLESLANAKRGKYQHIFLNSRPAGALLPTVELVDMRTRITKAMADKLPQSEGLKKRREFQLLSPRLFDEIDKALERKEQVLLYVGRRGFASAVQCASCGEVVSCPNCDIALTLHYGKVNFSGPSFETSRLNKNMLACHYCDYRIPIPSNCPACGFDKISPVGHGTERLEAEIRDFFPNASVARFDSDTVDNAKKRRDILSDMRSKKTDILIGTQMVTKGHDFPEITLVGVVDADLSLSIPDFRAAERTFQLLTQVAGRAGRAQKAGKVIIQTRQPTHISLVAASGHNIMDFANEELRHRYALSYPPFSRLANVKISSNSEESVIKTAQAVAKVLNTINEKLGEDCRCDLIGPSSAPILKLKGRYRWQLLIKAKNTQALSALVSGARPILDKQLSSKDRVSIDIDPINLF